MNIDISKKPANICCCHSRSKKDTKLCRDLVKQFFPLLQSKMITLWHPEDIKAGELVEQKTIIQIYTADIILLLISPDFFNSHSCLLQMEHALKMFYAQRARVIPVLLRPVLWKQTSIFNLVILPRNGHPITTWRNQEEATVDVVQEIEKIIMELYASFLKESQTPKEKQKLFFVPSSFGKQTSFTSETYSSPRQILTIDGFAGLTVHSKYKLSKSPNGEIMPVHLPLGIPNCTYLSYSIGTDDIKSTNLIKVKIKEGGVLLHTDVNQRIDSNEIVGDIYIQY
jgi:TIR domain